MHDWVIFSTIVVLAFKSISMVVWEKSWIWKVLGQCDYLERKRAKHFSCERKMEEEDEQKFYHAKP